MTSVPEGVEVDDSWTGFVGIWDGPDAPEPQTLSSEIDSEMVDQSQGDMSTQPVMPEGQSSGQFVKFADLSHETAGTVANEKASGGDVSNEEGPALSSPVRTRDMQSKRIFRSSNG